MAYFTITLEVPGTLKCILSAVDCLLWNPKEKTDLPVTTDARAPQARTSLKKGKADK